MNIDQAKQVQQIQQKYRRPFSAKRGALHKEERKARRARLANDSATFEIVLQQRRAMVGSSRDVKEF